MAEASSSERWEYRTIRPPRTATNKEVEDPESTLNELGTEGWELVNTLDYVGGGTKYLILKRAAPSGD